MRILWFQHNIREINTAEDAIFLIRQSRSTTLQKRDWSVVIIVLEQNQRVDISSYRN